MTRFAVLIFCLFLSCWPATYASNSMEVSSIEMRQAMQSSLAIQIQVAYPNVWATIGSGTLIKEKGKYGILTAAHVASSNDHMRACSVLDPEICTPLEGFIMTTDDEIVDDWAFYPLKEKLRGVRAARLDTSYPSVGDTVYQVGNPMGRMWVNKAVVSSPVFYKEKQLVRLDGFAYPGSSGGGVFNKHGKLIGITVALPIGAGLGEPELLESIALVVPIGNIEIF